MERLALSRITCKSVQQCWIVYPDNEGVEVWTFEEDPGFERFINSLPMRLAGETVGDIDLVNEFAAV